MARSGEGITLLLSLGELPTLGEGTSEGVRRVTSRRLGEGSSEGDIAVDYPLWTVRKKYASDGTTSRAFLFQRCA